MHSITSLFMLWMKSIYGCSSYYYRNLLCCCSYRNERVLCYIREGGKHLWSKNFQRKHCNIWTRVRVTDIMSTLCWILRTIIFYIVKGTGNSVFFQENESHDNPESNQRTLAIIKEIEPTDYFCFRFRLSLSGNVNFITHFITHLVHSIERDFYNNGIVLNASRFVRKRCNILPFYVNP